MYLLFVKERQAAWVAVGCAAMCAKAIRQRALMELDDDSVDEPIGAAAAANMPDYVALDSIGPVALPFEQQAAG